jgi:sterol 3beta-glucosyltransferase
MSSSQILTPRPPPSVEDREDDDDAGLTMEAPFFSRILQAEAEMQMSMHEEPLSEQEEDVESLTHKIAPVSLAQKLMEIFGFEEPEQVIGEYPCWLLQNVLVQGFMYVTQKHICFYAYLPKKATTVAYSGYLSKRGQRSSQHNRYWCELKGDVLSYFDDPSKKYFPKGQVDLRLGISASIDDKDKHKDHTHFTLATDKRDYHFKADTATSARDWVKMIQKVIFRAHNDGDSVKISLPIENIMDIEDNQILDFAETVKIRVIDNDETYAIDEVCDRSLQFTSRSKKLTS